MIAKLTGLVDSIGRDHAIIDVGGVGYLVRCSTRTLAALPPAGSVASVSVETLVREDAIDLYGFGTMRERDWFRLLTTVQGVGAKVALSILSALSADELSQAIMAQDKAMVSRADGVGPKLANRIVSELKDKVASGSFTPAAVTVSVPGLPADAVTDAVSALVNLGYRRAEAVGAIDKAARKLGPSARIEALIPAGLKELGT
ncbi:MAG TPA: Holliday junction branch migration protein RuvA [Alphaproteobacteria bacterium]|nr:Holliday junction branch migration protein RuvA [Alphaproteobacteria bacterium]